MQNYLNPLPWKMRAFTKCRLQLADWWVTELPLSLMWVVFAEPPRGSCLESGLCFVISPGCARLKSLRRPMVLEGKFPSSLLGRLRRGPLSCGLCAQAWAVLQGKHRVGQTSPGALTLLRCRRRAALCVSSGRTIPELGSRTRWAWRQRYFMFSHGIAAGGWRSR